MRIAALVVVVLSAFSVRNSALAQDCLPEPSYACVHPDATVVTSGDIGDGTVVGSAAYVGADVELGDGAFLAPRSRIEATTAGPALVAGDGLVLSRRAELAADVSLGADASIGRAVTVGERTTSGTFLSIGYGSTIGADSTLGDNVVLGTLTEVGDGAVVGDGAILARDVSVAAQGRVYGVVGPNTGVGARACVGPMVRVRKDTSIAQDVLIYSGARIGRGAVLEAGAVVGAGARIGAGATIAAGAVVPAGAVVNRAAVFSDSTGDPGSPTECTPIAPPASSGLLHHTFDDPGNPLLDASANGNDGTGSVGTSGGYATFSGSQVYSVPGTSNADWSGGLSVAVWIRWSGLSGSYRGVVSNGYHRDGSFEIRFGRESGGTRLGVVTNGAGGEVLSHSLYLNQNQWHHVALVHGANGVWRAYLDGVVADEELNVMWMPKTVSKPIYVGHNSDAWEWYAGSLEDLRVYDYGLSESEVQALAADAP